jgi:glycosyltransferase involved in cell wall biosynthesis
VIHLITTIERGGAENQLLVLVKAQIASKREVHVIYLKGSPELESELTSVGAFVNRSLAGLNPIFQILKLRVLLRKKNWILHCHLPRAELLGSFAANRVNLVISRHNAEPFFPAAPKLLSKTLSRFVCTRASSIVGISEAVREYLMASGEVPVSKRVEVIPYGYAQSNPRALSEQSLVNTPLRLGTVSRLAPQKDLHTLIRVFERYHELFPESTLSIVGGGPLELELKELVLELGLGHSVNFEGRSDAVMKHIKSWDIFLLTSKYEGFGMVLLEAMDASVPIIASNNSAIPEVLGRNFPGLGKTGDVDCFVELLIELQDPIRRAALLRIQESRLDLFKVDTMLLRMDSIYRV